MEAVFSPVLKRYENCTFPSSPDSKLNKILAIDGSALSCVHFVLLLEGKGKSINNVQQQVNLDCEKDSAQVILGS